METEILDALLDFLADGQWHRLTEISLEGLMEKVNFLAEYNFIELRRIKYHWTKTDQPLRGRPHGISILEARINPKVAEFWRKIKWIEKTDP